MIPINAITENIALYRRATQSTIAYGGDPNRAVDGNTNNKYAAGSCSHTLGSAINAWWMVDLGYQAHITRVEITNRDRAGE